MGRVISNYREFCWGLVWVAAFMLIFLIFGYFDWPLMAGPDSCYVTQDSFDKKNPERAKPCKGGDPLLCMDKCYCESIGPGLIKQPSSTWGNLGFIMVGLAILWWVGWQRTTQTRYGPANKMNSLQDVFYPTAYGNIVIFMGPGSMMFHGSMTYIGGVIDGMSMFMFGGFLAVYNIARFFNLPKLAAGLIYLMVVLACTIISAVGVGSEILLGLLLLIWFGFGMPTDFCKPKNHIWWGWVGFFAGIVAIGVAFLFWSKWHTDGAWCDPTATIQGHAIWHLLAAVMTGCVWLFFRGERAQVAR